MRRWWRSGLLVAAVAAVILVAGAPAQAAVPPKNVGWLYLDGGAGAAFFDADLAGHPSWEKITVCDNKANGRGVIATVYGDLWGAEYVLDPSNNGHCASIEGNFYPDGYGVHVFVNEYKGDINYPGVDGRGVA